MTIRDQGARVQVLAWLQPRDLLAGPRVVSALCLIGVGVTIVFIPLNSDRGGAVNLPLAVVGGLSLVVVVVMALAAWFFGETARLSWAISPFLTIAAIVAIDLATHDGSVAAQIFFLFPTLYGAALLPRRGAVLVVGATILGEALVVFTQLTFRDAVVDLGYVSAALAATAAMLIRGGEHQTALVAELERRASFDPLTGLVTRGVLDDATEVALGRTLTEGGTALIILDVDRFKSVNDRFGHPGGDQVLIQLATLLMRGSRRGDVVSRMGGDEIAVLMPNCSVAVAERRAQDFILEVRVHLFSLGLGATVNVSVSAGLAHAPTHALTASELYAAADAALYQAKRGGRDQVVAFAVPA